MQKRFATKVLGNLLRQQVVLPDDKILALCADARDAALFTELGFTNVTLSNLTRIEDREAKSTEFDYEWIHQDAQALELPDNSVDFAFVSAGLHHCQWPHRAVAEMYRVSRKGLVIFESRESALLRLAVRLGLTKEYEINNTLAQTLEFGGVNGGEIPNFVYRWTERDLEKTVNSMNPIGYC